MKITLTWSSLAETKPHEYAMRFLFGGLVTALVGVITTAFGPVIGGLFLAFPSIFPATVTLVERHEARKKEQQGTTWTALGQARCGCGCRRCGNRQFRIVDVWRDRLAVCRRPSRMACTGRRDRRVVPLRNAAVVPS